ncbi:MFS transporter [Aspergillus eucalypticola CBS 122712]|uniref:MFS transporter n=1 Tax=Aspergillus eucalypticola (strain CBS 122712 / IBT 29274) TaxID=1448314 RepID=A0A317V0V2_ASPEC|nr:MFS transporter [Aspergillus eucalypticola CBS 122712]PWY67011.1 MFS transporter [Aspergillus eucalypticola CBS 122712]
MAPSRVDSPEPIPSPAPGKLQSIQTQQPHYGDFRDDFFRDGYAVIKGVLSKERASEYQSEALTWLESFGLGFDRNDKSTWKKENLPQSWKGGMYLHFSAAHEKYVWDVRCEPGVIAPFAKLWGTDELVVSFDTVNITLPQSIVGTYDSQPWPHCDQAPERKGLVCVQGIVNLSNAGPDDGGLIVMKGSAALFDQFFEKNPVTGPTPWRTAKHKDFHPFSDKDLDWYRERGCELIKVCAEPGDLILWDSRQMHWAQFGTSDLVRTIVYATYTPAAWMSEEDREKKKELFEAYETTTHWPHTNLYTHGKAMVKVDGEEVVDPLERDEPLTKPVRNPLNYPQWQKWVITFVLGLFSVLGVLMTSGMGPFVTLMQSYYDYNPHTDDLMTYPTLFMGIGNVIAMPLAMAIGRRPVFLASALVLTVGSIWCAASTSLSSHIAGRDVLSLAAGQSEALCPLIIQEIHFVHERSSRLAWFSAIQSIGTAALTIATSYLVSSLGWRWWYGVFSIASGLVFISAFTLVPESRYDRPTDAFEGEVHVHHNGEEQVIVHATNKNRVPLDFINYKARTWKHTLAIMHPPANWKEALTCYKQMGQCILFPNILWVVLMNSVSLGIYVIGVTEYSSVLGAPPYNYPTTSLGLVQGGQIVVAMIMVPVLGYGGDQLYKLVARRRESGTVESEIRLIPMLLPIIVLLISCVIFGRAASHPTEWSPWAITTTFSGIYFAYIGIILSGYTYSLDSYAERAAPILVLICAIRGFISFGISFGVTKFITEQGFQGALNICAIIAGVVSALGIPIFFFGWWIRRVTMKYAVDGRTAEF